MIDMQPETTLARPVLRTQVRRKEHRYAVIRLKGTYR